MCRATTRYNVFIFIIDDINYKPDKMCLNMYLLSLEVFNGVTPMFFDMSGSVKQSIPILNTIVLNCDQCIVLKILAPKAFY